MLGLKTPVVVHFGYFLLVVEDIVSAFRFLHISAWNCRIVGVLALEIFVAIFNFCFEFVVLTLERDGLTRGFP
jgi:hypothetical protein